MSSKARDGFRRYVACTSSISQFPLVICQALSLIKGANPRRLGCHIFRLEDGFHVRTFMIGQDMAPVWEFAKIRSP